MKNIGLLVTKDEAPILEATLRANTRYISEIYALYGSDDGTYEILKSFKEVKFCIHESELFSGDSDEKDGFCPPSNSVKDGIRGFLYREIKRTHDIGDWVTLMHGDEIFYHDPNTSVAIATLNNFNVVQWYAPHFFLTPDDLKQWEVLKHEPLEKRITWYATNRYPLKEYRQFMIQADAEYDIAVHSKVIPTMSKMACLPICPIYKHFKVWNLNLDDYEMSFSEKYGRPIAALKDKWGSLHWEISKFEDFFIESYPGYDEVHQFRGDFGRFEKPFNKALQGLRCFLNAKQLSLNDIIKNAPEPNSDALKKHPGANTHNNVEKRAPNVKEIMAPRPLNLFTFCVDLKRHTQDELLCFLKILVASLDLRIKKYKLVVFTNFDLNIHHPNVELRLYYDNSVDKMYQDPWKNLSFNKINIYKDLLDETGIDFLWLDLDTYVAADINYINDLASCFVEHGGSVEKPWPLFDNSDAYHVPTHRYIQGNIWKLNIELYEAMMSTLQKLKDANLHPRFDLQDIFNYYFHFELGGDISNTHILGLNSKPESINGLGIWDRQRSIGPQKWSVGKLYLDDDQNLRTHLFPDKVIHFVSFVMAQTIPLLNEPEFTNLFMSTGKKGDREQLASLQVALAKHPDDIELLNAFFNIAVSNHEYEHARAFLDQLQEQQPRNHAIRKLYIGICLKQKDYSAAMEAIETLAAFSNADDGLIDAGLAVRKHIGPRRIDSAAAEAPTVSLCMIVRNEAGFLSPCLNSIKHLADEMIVVDTGSTDRSGDIARLYGCRVYDFEWCDDFSAARNHALSKAGGDWILVLDADELIAPGDQLVIKQLLKKEKKFAKAYSFQTRNYSNLSNGMEWQANDGSYPQQEAGSGWFPSDKVRLFPRNPGIRFDYPVHELVEPSVRKLGWNIASSPVPIHHYGQLNETKNRRKAESYFKLGYAKLDQLGNDGAALRELAVQAGQLGRWTEAIDLWQRFLAVCPAYPEAYANLAGAHWQLGQYDQGIRFSEKAIQADPEIKEGHYNLAVNLIMMGEVEKAAAVLNGILQRHDRYLPARFMLAAVRCGTQDRQAGQEAFAKLMKEVPPQVLSIAVKDLVEKLKNSGRFDFAKAVQASASMT